MTAAHSGVGCRVFFCVRLPGRQAGMHVQFDTMAMQMSAAEGSLLPSSSSCFPNIFSAVSNHG